MRMNWLLTTTALCALLLCATLPVACVDTGEAISGPPQEGTGGQQVVGSAGPGATGSGGSGGGMGGAGGSGSGMDSGLPDGALEQCISMVDAMDACGVCACNNCLPELYACNMDVGCVAIRDCARMNMCSGAACLGPCGTVIDMHGGVTGMSASLGLALSGCTEMNCMVECAPMP